MYLNERCAPTITHPLITQYRWNIDAEFADNEGAYRGSFNPCRVAMLQESSTNRAARSGAHLLRFLALLHCYLVPERV